MASNNLARTVLERGVEYNNMKKRGSPSTWVIISIFDRQINKLLKTIHFGLYVYTDFYYLASLIKENFEVDSSMSDPMDQSLMLQTSSIKRLLEKRLILCTTKNSDQLSQLYIRERLLFEVERFVEYCASNSISLSSSYSEVMTTLIKKYALGKGNLVLYKQ